MKENWFFSSFLYVYCDIVLNYLGRNSQSALGDRILRGSRSKEKEMLNVEWCLLPDGDREGSGEGLKQLSSSPI